MSTPDSHGLPDTGKFSKNTENILIMGYTAMATVNAVAAPPPHTHTQWPACHLTANSSSSPSGPSPAWCNDRRALVLKYNRVQGRGDED